MVMGGLISDTRGNTSDGPPAARRASRSSAASSASRSCKNNRTELVLFITPRVVENEIDYDAVINDLRRRMENLDRVFPGTSDLARVAAEHPDRVPRWLAPSVSSCRRCRSRSSRCRPRRRQDHPRADRCTQADVSPAAVATGDARSRKLDVKRDVVR